MPLLSLRVTFGTSFHDHLVPTVFILPGQAGVWSPACPLGFFPISLTHTVVRPPTTHSSQTPEVILEESFPLGSSPL